MACKWTDFDDVIHMAETLRSQERNQVHPPNAIAAEVSATMECMDSVIMELRFLCTFLGYAQIFWSDAFTAASESHSHDTSTNAVTDMDSMVGKVAAAAKAFRKDLHNAFVDNYSDYYFTEMELELTTQLASIWRKTRHCFPCCGSKPSKLVQVFTYLDEQIGFLKPQIREALESFDSHKLRPKPRLLNRKQISAWEKYCDFVELNLQLLLETSYLPGPLAEQMGAFKQSLDSWRRLVRYVWIRGSKETRVTVHFGEVVIRVAHLCCFCWYAPLDQNTAKDVAVLLSDLHHKIDLTSSVFVDLFLEFIGLYYVWDYAESVRKRYVVFFVRDMLGAREGTVLHNELVELVPFLLQKPDAQSMDVRIFSVDIKDAFMEAIYLKNKELRAYITDFVVLFAKIWFIKADIFVKCRPTHAQSMKGQIKAIDKGSRFLIKSFTPTVEKTEYQILKLIEEVPGRVKSLHQAKDLVGYQVRDVLYKFLVKFILFKAKALLSELLNNDASLMLPLKPQINVLHDGLIWMIESDINEENNNTEEKLILTYMEAVATSVKSLCNSFPAAEVTEEAVKRIEPQLFNLLQMVQRLKVKLKELYLKIPTLNFPKIPRLCFFEFFLQKLRQLISSKQDSVAYPTHHIEAFHGDLEFIVSNFRDVNEQSTGNQERKDYHERLIGLVHEAEYVIDSIVQGSDATTQHLLWLHHLSEEIRQIKMQLAHFYANNPYDDGVQTVPQRLMPVESQVTAPSTEEVMVGLNDQKEAIVVRLTRGTLQRDIVSIVGMPGIGKTTLANNVFCSPSITHHFQIRAWCFVSQTYRKRDLLLDILSHITRLTDNIFVMKDEDLDLLLYKNLKKKRYLIIMDDLWSTGAWDDLQRSFPDDSNGSRILMTSRLHDEVSKVSDPHILRPLSNDESWELLRTKIFHEEQCPEELLEVGQQIAVSCKGLPLAIGAVAGILDRIDENEDRWKEIAESVCSRIVSDPQTRCMDILELSYNHLPDHLKACFLYFGAFPGDKDIPVQRLLWLWIAEGFIYKLESKRLEDLAEEYLMDLVGRSLVIVSKRRSNGTVKACRVHDLVRDLFLLKAKTDSFLQMITSNDEPYSSFDGLDYAIPYMLLNHSKSQTYEEHRLCICVNREHFVVTKPSGPYVRSLLFFATIDMYPRCPYDVSFISNNFKLLKVLDLESINMGNSLEIGIHLLVHLRYLAVSGDMDSIPSSLSNLQNLETLLVKGFKRMVVLPNTLWSMRKLRHLHVSNAIFTLHEEDGNHSQLDSLVTLSFPFFRYGEETDSITRRFPNLRKLRCTFLDLQDVSMNFCHFPRLESLCQLESLRISHYGRDLNPGELNLPSSLKKLSLSNFRLPWNHMSAIGRLPNLEVLKLISIAFEGSSWEMTEGEFLKLKYLELDTLNVVHWDASSDHLPQLQQLVLRNCKQLKEIPFDFVCISTLQKIEVEQCGVSAEESIRKIEEQEIEGLKIVINNSHLV